MKNKRLNDKLKYIKSALRTPYHFFTFTSAKLVMAVFENKNGVRFTYSGTGIFDAIVNAEKYVNDEIEAGQLKAPKK